MEEQRKKMLKDKKEAQKALQQQPAFGQPAKPGFGQQPGGGRNGGQQREQRQEQRQRLSERIGEMPVMLTMKDLQSLIDMYDEGSIILPDVELRDGRRRFRRDGGAAPDGVEDPEFERKHPRDAHGKFAKKEEAAKDEGEGEEVEGEGYGVLDQEPWPGATSWTAPNGDEIAIKGVVELDGIEYTVVEGVSKEELIAIHETNKQVYERASAVYGKELAKVDVAVIPYNEGEMVALATQHPLKGTDEGVAIIDTGFKDRDQLEAMLVHENFHMQPRTGRSGTNPEKSPMMAEEAFNGLLQLEYCERYGLPAIVGWGFAVSPLVAAAQAHGWDKQELYSYARLAQAIDGSQYKHLTNSLIRGTGVKLTMQSDALDEWYEGWEDTLEDYYASHGMRYKPGAWTDWPSEYSDWEGGQ
jgi:hypothetical protein